jgi:hypothetical protein
MQITIKINGVLTTKTLPISWQQVTFGTFLKLTECGDDYVKVFAALTGIDEAILKKANIENLDTALALIEFLKTECPAYVPKTILQYKVPENLGLKTLGQYTDLKAEMKRSANLTGTEALKKYLLYCAIYACDQKHGEYDWEKSEWMADEFLEAPSPEVLGIGNFTLKKLIELNYGISPTSLPHLTPAKKYKQVLKNLPSILGITQLFSSWRKKPHSTVSNS